MTTFLKMLAIAATLTLGAIQPSLAQSGTEGDADTVLVTVILKHDQSMNITDIVDAARANGLYDSFPPAAAEVMNWTIAMGLGQIVTLEVPPSAIRDLNRALEFGAWGAFETDVYLGYDFEEIAQRLHEGAYRAREAD